MEKMLIGKLISTGRIRRFLMVEEICKVWRVVVAENTYRFLFSKKRDRDNISHLGPWSFRESLLTLRECSLDIAAEKMEFKIATFFAHVHGFSPKL